MPKTKRLKRLQTILFFCTLPVTPLLAQTQIGGGSCTSSSLNGTYSVTLTGRNVTSTGALANIIQANGSATFDGQTQVSLTLNANTNQSAATPLSWSGTYSLQVNCAGVATISVGGGATLNLAVYGQGANVLLTGSDATYVYSGSASRQPIACPAAVLSGVYTFNGTGFGLTSNAVSGAANAAGLMQFDGQGHLVVNITLSATGTADSPVTLTGSYSVGSNCLGVASLTDTKSNSYSLNFSVTAGTAVSTSTLNVTLAQSSKFILSGAAHAIYGQPTAVAATNPAFQGARA